MPPSQLGLVALDLDAFEDGAVTALWAVGDVMVSIKQRPEEGREYDEEKEELQQYAMQHPEASFASRRGGGGGGYDSAFPKVGLVVWQSGFVLAELLLRTQPLGPWAATAEVLLTDLEHIVPLTQSNIDLNASRCAVTPRAQAYMWGDPIGQLQQQQLEQEQRQQQQEQQQQQPCWDIVVATDVLYEPQHYDELLCSLMQLCPPPPQPAQPAAGQSAAAGAAHAALPQPAAAGAAAAAGAGGGGDPGSAARSPPVFICYRVRRYGEHGFENKATRAGFSVAAVPLEELHEDFRCGGYRTIRLDRVAAGQAQQQDGGGE